MKYIFIVNPNAGKGKCKELLPKIEEECKKRNREFEIREISDEKSGFDIALEYKEQENVIYVVGGDGTLSVTLPALVGTKTSLELFLLVLEMIHIEQLKLWKMEKL